MSVPRSALLLLALVLAGCGAHRHRAGAEPAVSPPATAHPAGRQVRVGAHPEGIVADPALGLIAVATRDPAQITVIKAGSGAVVKRIPTGGAVRHLGLQGNTVLVPDAPENRLLRITLPGGRLRATAVGREPHDAAAVDGRIVVADEFGRGASVIEPDGGVRMVPGFVQPGGVAAVGSDAAVVDVGADTLTLVDPRTLRRLARLPAGSGPTHVATIDGDVFVADTRGDALLQFTTRGRTLRQVARIALRGRPYGIAVDPVRDRVWVTLTAINQLVELSGGPNPPRVLARFATGRQPNTVAVDDRTGRVFVALAAVGTVELIDPGP